MRNTHELEDGGHKTTAAKKYFSKRETQNKQVVMHRDVQPSLLGEFLSLICS
jgi:hypothetical protein